MKDYLDYVIIVNNDKDKVTIDVPDLGVVFYGHDFLSTLAAAKLNVAAIHGSYLDHNVIAPRTMTYEKALKRCTKRSMFPSYILLEVGDSDEK